ncbi:hypothetical protein R8Z50_19610 [Longispora sp. K20-0274]
MERGRREFEPWPDERLVLDSVDDLSANVGCALRFLSGPVTP